jgi:hypothetical protein
MQDFFGTELDSGLCAIKLIPKREHQLGFFIKNKRGNLKFKTMKLFYDHDEKKVVVEASLKNIKDTDQFVSFEYSQEKVDHLFAETNEFMSYLKGSDRTAVKTEFINLCSQNSVLGAPALDEEQKQEDLSDIPDYLHVEETA